MDQDRGRDAEIVLARHIQRYLNLFERQAGAAGEPWPAELVFPEPRADIERSALRLFLNEVQVATGGTVTITQREGTHVRIISFGLQSCMQY